MTIAGRDGRFTRRPVPRADLYAASPDTDRSQVDEILEAFAARRLVVLDNSTAQIAHDALLRAWPRLRAWLAEDQATWVLYGQLADDAAEWQAQGGDPSFLYRGTQLASVRQAADLWSGDSSRYPALTATQQAFLKASTRAATRATRQRRALSVVLVFLLIASLAGATIAIQKARTANAAALAAVSGQLAAQSEAVDAADPFQAAELAAASWRLAPTARARALARVSLLDVLAQPDRGVLATPGESVNAVAFSPDGKMLATVGYQRHDPVVGRRHPPADRRADDGRQFVRGCGGVQPGRQDAGHRERRRHGPVVGCEYSPADRRADDRRQQVRERGGIQPGRQDAGHRRATTGRPGCGTCVLTGRSARR